MQHWKTLLNSTYIYSYITPRPPRCSALVLLVAVGTRQRGTGPPYPGNQALGHPTHHTLSHPVIVKHEGMSSWRILGKKLPTTTIYNASTTDYMLCFQQVKCITSLILFH